MKNRTKLPAQQCPICRARQPLEAPRCTQCGAALNGAPLPVTKVERPTARRIEAPTTGWEVGEADHYARLLPASPIPTLLFAALMVAIIFLGVFMVSQLSAGAPTTGEAGEGPTAAYNLTVVVAADSVVIDGGRPNTTRRAPPPTNTRVVVVPTVELPTVTLAPPTATITPTPGPCFQKAAAGDTVYGMAARCGHREMAVVESILRINNMTSAAELQIGQTLEIPWPTPVGGGPEAVAGDPGNSTDQQPDAANYEPTLPPGITWYTVQKGETAVSIVFDHGITMRILRDLNPEVMFDNCDYGLPAGGASCSVMVYEGQRMRVPAPTPTPTLRPTLSGSETPTPVPSPTINAPFAQSPGDNMLFEAFELPTLRWVATGQLTPTEVFLITVIDETAKITHNATTRELSLPLPAEWQPTDGARHRFSWKVTIATLRDGVAFPSSQTTETRTFTWQSR